jgi:hypothetical protein
LEVTQEKLAAQRYAALRGTAEEFARRKLNDAYILGSLFEGPDLSKRAFPEDAIDNLAEDESEALFRAFAGRINEFSDLNLKRISLVKDVQDRIRFADDVEKFFGRGVAYLTFYQFDVGTYASYFNQIINGKTRPPAEIIGDPEKLMDWHLGSNHANKVASSTENAQNVAIIGDTKDLESMKKDPNVVSLSEVTKGKKSVRGREFMKLLQ